MKKREPVACAIAIALIVGTSAVAFAADRGEGEPHERSRENWRRLALETMRVASAEHLISAAADLNAYRAAGFNTMVVFDVDGCNDSGTAWNFKSEEQIERETSFARQNGIPLILGLAVEAFAPAVSANRTPAFAPYARHQTFVPSTSIVGAYGVIPQASDDEITARVELWKKYGDDVVIGTFPWYDDVFYESVDVDRQRHVYQLIKGIARTWYVFGLIGEFGFNATDEEVARRYDPSAFDHLIVLMYPFNVGAAVTGFPLDNAASSDPDGDITRYVDRFIDRMNQKFFSMLKPRQLILLVVQAFYYPGEPAGHIPRPRDIEIMTQHGNDQLRMAAGQERNFSAAYFYWGAAGSFAVGLSQRTDWLSAASGVNDELERRDPRPSRDIELTP